MWKKVGNIKGKPGSDGVPIVLTKDEGKILWKYRGSDVEHPLISLEELRGPRGKDGVGRDGRDGKDGVGIPGKDGEDGLSAYEIWKAKGGKGTVEDFLKSLRGPRGISGYNGNSGGSGGTIDLTTDVEGILPIANGGTGADTAAAAITALLPSQGSNGNKVLTTNGTVASWNLLTTTNFSSANISQWTNNSGYITIAGVTGLTTSNFASANVSQWTNDAGYLTESAIDYSAVTITRDGNNLATLITYAGPETITPTRDGDGFITSFVDTRFGQTVTITRNADGFATSTAVT